MIWFSTCMYTCYIYVWYKYGWICTPAGTAMCYKLSVWPTGDPVPWEMEPEVPRGAPWACTPSFWSRPACPLLSQVTQEKRVSRTWLFSAALFEVVTTGNDPNVYCKDKGESSSPFMQAPKTIFPLLRVFSGRNSESASLPYWEYICISPGPSLVSNLSVDRLRN